MRCPKCGALLEEDSKFCTFCGANLKVFAPVSSEPFKPDSGIDEENLKKTSNSESKGAERAKRRKIGLAVGTFIIIVGIIRIMSAGTSISSTSFGGDFYTYTYQGIVAISEILASIEVSLGWIIVAIGAAIDVNSLRH